MLVRAWWIRGSSQEIEEDEKETNNRATGDARGAGESAMNIQADYFAVIHRLSSGDETTSKLVTVAQLRSLSSRAPPRQTDPGFNQPSGAA